MIGRPADESRGISVQREGIAFIDESMRASPGGSMYLIAAAVVLRGDRPAVERRLRTAVGRRRHRAHWHDESERSRFKLVECLAGVPLSGITVAVAPVTPRRQEKARELALWNLVNHLEPLAVTELILEARQDKLNDRDRRTIWSIQRSGLGLDMHYRFGRPSEDVGLWAADVLAGAVGMYLAHDDDRYIKVLPDELLTLHRVAGEPVSGVG